MGKNSIRLTESQLHKVIRESVKSILLNEGSFFDFFRKKQPSQEQQVSAPPRQRSAKEIELRKVRDGIYPRFNKIHDYKMARGLADRHLPSERFGGTTNVYMFINSLQIYLKGYVDNAINIEAFPESRMRYRNDMMNCKDKLSRLIGLFESSSDVFSDILANMQEAYPKKSESFVEEYEYYKDLVRYCKEILNRYR